MNRFVETLPFNLRQGAKVALAATLSYVCATWAGLLYPYIAVVSTVIVVQVYVADTVQMAALRVAGTVIGCLVGVAALALLPGTFAWSLAGLFVTVFVCAFLISYSSYFRMAAITVAIVYLAGLGEENSFAFALERTLEIVIGVVCALGVSLLVFPDRASRALGETLHGYHAEAARLCGLLLGAFLDLQRRGEAADMGRLDRLFAQAREFLGKALRSESWLVAAEKRQTLVEVARAERIHEGLHGMAHALSVPHGQGVRFLIEPELRALGEAVVEALKARGLAARKACETASRVVKSGKGSGMKFGWPDISPHAPPHSPSAGTGAGKPREPWRAALLTALERCDARLAELRAQGITRRLSLEKLSQFYAFYGALHALADFLAREDMVSADA